MKLKQVIVTSFALLTFLISSSAKTEDYQHSAHFAQEIGRSAVDPFLPITFSPEGLNGFIKNVYNLPKYGTEILPNDFSHMLQFLQYGIDADLGVSFAQSVFKLFGNKLKSASYVNAYVFADTLAPLESILKNYFSAPKTRPKQVLKTTINDVLYSSFLSQFDFFKRDPKTFFNNLSGEILTSLGHELASTQKEIQKEQLRQTAIRFFELCASKLVWSPEDATEMWRTVQLISKRLAHLMKHNIISDVDHLDDLFWSITHRFCFFVDLFGSDLPLAFYQNIRQDLIRKKGVLCKLEEQEKLITSKTEHIMKAVTTGEAKARAREVGIIA